MALRISDENCLCGCARVSDLPIAPSAWSIRACNGDVHPSMVRSPGSFRDACSTCRTGRSRPSGRLARARRCSIIDSWQPTTIASTSCSHCACLPTLHVADASAPHLDSIPMVYLLMPATVPESPKMGPTLMVHFVRIQIPILRTRRRECTGVVRAAGSRLIRRVARR